MNYYLVKMVYRIICGDGVHTPQFDEQLRLIHAASTEEAFDKAALTGEAEAETFFNQKEQLVQWKFINVSEIYQLTGLVHGAELYSQIREVDDAEAYITFVHHKASNLKFSEQTYQPATH
ncbi:MAG TPA: DUF4288 domain-containing protein [Flavisolibacter sp.]|jgi:hypothetical protein|nr:DUF4288 domain-containing protein [Flavisolibacter sp.]